MNNIETTDWLTKGISEKQLAYEKYCSSIAFKLWQYKDLNHITQTRLTQILGISLRKLRRWESGLYDFSEDEINIIKNKLHIID